MAACLRVDVTERDVVGERRGEVTRGGVGEALSGIGRGHARISHALMERVREPVVAM